MFRRISVLLMLTALAAPVLAQQARPDWGVAIGPIPKEVRIDGQWYREDRPVYLATFGDTCAEVSVETVIFSEKMWAAKHPAESGATAAFQLLEIMANTDGLLPPCDDIIFVNRLVNSDNGTEVLFEDHEPIQAKRLAALVLPQDVTETGPFEPLPEWGVMIGSFQKSYRDTSGIQQTSRPVWVQTYGDTCASLVVETVLFSEPMWNDRRWIGSGSTASETILNSTKTTADLLSACETTRILNRRVNESNGDAEYFDGRDPIRPSTFAAYEDTKGADGRPLAYRNLPGLPSTIDVYWASFYMGDFGGPGTNPQDRSRGDRLVANYAYHGITRAYSDQVNERANCRFGVDKRTAIKTIVQSDRNDSSTSVEDPNQLILHHPTTHGSMIDRAFVGERNPDLRIWIADGRKIMTSFGCQSDGLLVLRENLRRFIEWEEPMTGEEVKALLANS